MRVLVTGGTGVVGKPAVDRLLGRGHTVRLLSRHAERDAKQWPERVEAFEATVGDPEGIRGAAEGCGAVLHVAGIVAEEPPEVTFQRVNVDGTRHLVEEAQRAGVKRFVYVSSLGANRGESDYHRSKLAGEEVTRGFAGEWLILRPGNVYGPGDEVVSLLLKMVRALPAVPVIGDGDQPFQPVWADDAGQALALAVERGEPGKVYPLAGPEQTSMTQLLDMLGEVTGKRPPRIPVPNVIASLGTQVMDTVGLDLLPVHRDQIIMLEEGNVIPPGEENALSTVFGVEPTPLAKGLALLADSLPEQLPSEGVGELHRQRYWADIQGSTLSAERLLDVFRREFSSLTPDGTLQVGTEPGSGSRLEQGETVTLEIPLRGTMQVRVEEVTPESVTLATVGGHHLAGVIRFQSREHDGDRIRFEIVSYTRASTWVDWIGRALVGRPLQHATWRSTVQSVVERSGGTAPDGVQSEETTISETERIERWAEELVMARKREEAE
jgi:nucleoside-diphosphate-sugar epimerase